MNTEYEFDLNHAIQQWRNELAQSPSLHRENLDELESHLRDSVMALEARGLSAAESFLVATRRIGGSRTLESEFGKVNGQAIWFDRLFWMLIGLQVWGFLSGIIRLLSCNGMFFGLAGAGFDFRSHGLAIPATLSALFYLAGLAGGLLFCWWLFSRQGGRLGKKLGTLLHRKTTWAMTFGVLYLLSLSVPALNGVVQVLFNRSFGPEVTGGMYASLSIAYAIAALVTPAVVVWLTLLLARKRLCASGA